jgi:hypothetical protein
MQAMLRLMLIGIQDFEDLRRRGFVYVDKTVDVWKLVTKGKTYFLSRPRRFGKSLLLSTLKAYFQGKKELFDGLAIADMEKEWRPYPVLHLDFNPSRYDSVLSLTKFVAGCLAEMEAKHGLPPVDDTEEVQYGFPKNLYDYLFPGTAGMDGLNVWTCIKAVRAGGDRCLSGTVKGVFRGDSV